MSLLLLFHAPLGAGRSGSAVVSGGGDIEATGYKAARGAVTIAGGGGIIADGVVGVQDVQPPRGGAFVVVGPARRPSPRVVRPPRREVVAVAALPTITPTGLASEREDAPVSAEPVAVTASAVTPIDDDEEIAVIIAMIYSEYYR